MDSLKYCIKKINFISYFYKLIIKDKYVRIKFFYNEEPNPTYEP